jgi:hypothetical protein
MGGGVRVLRHFSAILVLPGALLAGCARVDNEPRAVPSDELWKIAEALGLRIVTVDSGFPVKSTHGTIDGKDADAEELRAYSRLFAQEFALYPPDLVRRSHLKSVVLCRELAFAGQRRNAIPDFEHDTLYLDVSRGTYSKSYLRKVIHHEFFHVIDYRDDGSLYEDDRWKSLNPAGFKYGTGGRNAQEMSQTSVLTAEFPGFLNHYSTTAVEEDKAEVFANLIVDLECVEDTARGDPVLRAKVAQVKELLARFSPEMNDNFWEAVRTMHRPDKGSPGSGTSRRKVEETATGNRGTFSTFGKKN